MHADIAIQVEMVGKVEASVTSASASTAFMHLSSPHEKRLLRLPPSLALFVSRQKDSLSAWRLRMLD